MILEVKELKKYFEVPSGILHAVDGATFQIERGKTLGVVGESGCGKSTLGRVILHLLDSSGGKILFDGKDITHVSRRELRNLQREMQIIFQDPYSSLNPRMTVSEIIREPLEISKIVPRAGINIYVRKIMDTVGLAKRLANSYPHELDGGRRQRIGVARALVLNPRFVVCDEPVSALDVSIQAQIINLLLDLQKEMGLTYMFITHDMSVVKYISHNIMVMYLGHIVELSSTQSLFKNTFHPYTKALLSAIPLPDIDIKTERILLRGELSSPINPKPGCAFATRCIYAKEKCAIEDPGLEEILPGHMTACHYTEEINGL